MINLYWPKITSFCVCIGHFSMYKLWINIFQQRYGPDLPVERNGEVWDFAEGGPDDDGGRAERSQVLPSQRNARHKDQTAKRTSRSLWLPGQSIYLCYQLKSQYHEGKQAVTVMSLCILPNWRFKMSKISLVICTETIPKEKYRLAISYLIIPRALETIKV